jgi:hypothetical protein
LQNPLLAFGLPPEEAALGALCLAAVGLPSFLGTSVIE